MLIIYKSFLVESLRHPVYTQQYMHTHVIASTDRNPLTFYFPIYSFYSLLLLLWLRLSVLYIVRVQRLDILLEFVILVVMLSSPHTSDVAVGLPYIALCSDMVPLLV